MSRYPVLIAVVASAVAGAALMLLLSTRETNPADAGFPVSADIDPAGAERPASDAAVERRFAGIEAEIAALRRELDRWMASSRVTPAAAGSGPPANGASESGPALKWYLDQYVLSFEEDPEASEYFRMAVDAYATRLLAEIIALVSDSSEPARLRERLLAMLGTTRFFERTEAVDAALGVVDAPPSARSGSSWTRSAARAGTRSTPSS